MARYLVCSVIEPDGRPKTTIFPIKHVTSPYDVTLPERTFMFFFANSSENSISCATLSLGNGIFFTDMSEFGEPENGTVYLRGKEVNLDDGEVRFAENENLNKLIPVPKGNDNISFEVIDV